MSESKNIYQRINDVMKIISYVKKDKAVDAPGQKYKAVTHDQVISVARKAIVEAGIVIYPEQTSSQMLVTRDLKQDIKMHLYEGNYNIHFVNIDDPQDRVTVPIGAQAADNGDKAPGKAVTYATKAAILKVLLLETGEDDESRAEQVAPITEIQAKAIRNLLDGAPEGTEERMLASLDIESVEEISKKEYDEVVAKLKSTKRNRQ